MYLYALYDDILAKSCIKLHVSLCVNHMTLLWSKPKSDVINSFYGMSAFQRYPICHDILKLKQYMKGINFMQIMLLLTY